MCLGCDDSLSFCSYKNVYNKIWVLLKTICLPLSNDQKLQKIQTKKFYIRQVPTTYDTYVQLSEANQIDVFYNTACASDIPMVEHYANSPSIFVSFRVQTYTKKNKYKMFQIKCQSLDFADR